jgi:WD40 repeat protein
MRIPLLCLALLGLPLTWSWGGPTQSAKDVQPATDAHGDPLPTGAIARIGTLRLRHSTPIVALAWAHDSSFLVSGSHDKTVCLWDAKTGKLLRRITGHDDAVFALALSSDSKKLATGGADKTVRLWDVASGKELWRSDAHKGWVCSVAFSPDDRLLASGGTDGKVRLWDVVSGKQLAVLTDTDTPQPGKEGELAWQSERHKPAVCSLAFSPDGATLASGGKNRFVHLWDVKAGKKIKVLTANPPAVVLGLAFSPDGKALSSASAAGTQLWDVGTGTLRVSLDGDGSEASGVHFSRDGNTLVSCPALLSTQYVRLSDARTGRCKQLIKPGSAYWTLAAVLSPDSRTLACAGYDQIIRLLDVATGKDHIADAGENSIHRYFALSHDGRLLAASSRIGTVTLHDAVTGKALRELASDGSRLAGSLFFPSDKHLLVSNANNNLFALDVTSAALSEKTSH